MKRIVIGILVIALAGMSLWAEGGSEAKSSELPKLTIFNNRPARSAMPEGVDFWDNPYINYIRESSGIDPIYLRPENSTYNDKLNLVMASGDMPDLVQSKSYSMFYKFVKDGLVVPLDDLLQKYGQDILAHMPKNMWRHVTVNGKIYGLPAVYFAPIPGKDGIPNRLLWVRDDWMKNLGIADPVTLEDFTNMLQQFVKNDPDGNGKDDTIGVSAYVRGGWLQGLDPEFGAFGVIQNYWTEVDGKLVFNNVRPEMKEALTYLHGLYEDGLLDPEFYLNDSKRIMEKVYQGKLGVWRGSWWEPDSRTKNIVGTTGVTSGPEGLLRPLHSPTGPHGDKGVGGTLALAEGVYFVTIDAEDPALAVKFYNWRFSDAGINYDFGFLGKNFTIENGVRKKNPESRADGYRRAYHTTYVPWSDADFEQYVRDATANEDMFKVGWEALQISAEDSVTSAVPYYSPESEIEYGPDNMKMWLEYVTKIISGEYEIDKWDEYVQRWYKNGGTQITADMNAFYKSQQ